MKLYMFRTVLLPIIRSSFSVHSAMVYVIQVCRQLSSGTRMELIYINCPKHVDFHARMILLESCLQTCITLLSVQ